MHYNEGLHLITAIKSQSNFLIQKMHQSIGISKFYGHDTKPES